MFPHFSTGDEPFFIYTHDKQPHVLIRQPETETSDLSTRRVSGFLLFMDESSGAPRLTLALEPRKGAENVGLLALIEGNEGVKVEAVDYKRLPWIDRREIRHTIEHDVDGKMALEAYEEHSDGATPDALEHIREEVVSKLPQDHNLVSVRAANDDAKLTEIRRFLKSEGVLTSDSEKALEAAATAMAEPEHFDRRALTHKLNEIFNGHRLEGGTHGVAFIG